MTSFGQGAGPLHGGQHEDAWVPEDLKDLAHQQVQDLCLPEGATFAVAVDTEVGALVLTGRRGDHGAIILVDLETAYADADQLEGAITELALRLTVGPLQPSGPLGVLPVEMHIRTGGAALGPAQRCGGH